MYVFQDTRSGRCVQGNVQSDACTHASLFKAFNGKTEIADNAEFNQPTGRAALQAAKTKSISKPSLQSRITIGFGEGRATRECKFKWIPLYDSSSNGVSTFRVYVSKVHL